MGQPPRGKLINLSFWIRRVVDRRRQGANFTPTRYRSSRRRIGGRRGGFAAHAAGARR